MSNKRKRTHKPRFKPLPSLLQPAAVAAMWEEADAAEMAFEAIEDAQDNDGPSGLEHDDGEEETQAELIFDKAIERAFSKKMMDMPYVRSVMSHLTYESAHGFLEHVEDKATIHYTVHTSHEGQDVIVKSQIFCVPLMGRIADIDALFAQESTLTRITKALRESGAFAQATNSCIVGGVFSPLDLLEMDPQLLYNVLQKAAQALTVRSAGSMNALTRIGNDLYDMKVRTQPKNDQKGAFDAANLVGIRFLMGVQTRVVADVYGDEPMDTDILSPESWIHTEEDIPGRLDAIVRSYNQAMETIAGGKGVFLGLPNGWNGIRKDICDQTVSLALNVAKPTEAPHTKEDGYTLHIYEDEDYSRCAVCDSTGAYFTGFSLPHLLCIGSNADYIESLEETFDILYVDDPDDLPKPRMAA